MIRACIEQQSLRYYIEEAKRQNKEYFEIKARDLISKEKDDMVAAVQANLLFQSLNMTREELMQEQRALMQPEDVVRRLGQPAIDQFHGHGQGVELSTAIQQRGAQRVRERHQTVRVRVGDGAEDRARREHPP